MLRILASAGLLACVIAPQLSAQGCPELDTPIWAGQTIRSGEMEISNSATHLRLDSRAFAPWQIRAVHIYAGLDPVPTSGGGNMAPGQFPYQTEYNPPVDRHVEMIALSDLGAGCGDTLYVAAHYEMVQVDDDGNVVAEETGWAHGKESSTGSQWGWWEYYDLCCLGSGCAGSGLTLGTTPLIAGQSATLTLSGADPGEAVAFYYNASGKVVCDGGPSLANLGGMRLDLIGPVRTAGTAVADAAGVANLVVTVPATAIPGWVALQGAIARGAGSIKSNPLNVSLLP